MISKRTSSFIDFFGVQSRHHNKKLKTGEDICFSRLRIQTLNQEGNLAIATDIDYSELGTEKGIVVVYTVRTTIKLNNLEILEEKIRANQRNNYCK